MGYELHITRAERWYESEDHPISEEEWESFARNDPSLVLDGTVYGHVCADGETVSLRWSGGEILVKGVRGRKAAAGLVRMAEALGARLLGDDGEVYERGLLSRLRRLLNPWRFRVSGGDHPRT